MSTGDPALMRGIIAELALELLDPPVMSNLARPAYVGTAGASVRNLLAPSG